MSRALSLSAAALLLAIPVFAGTPCNLSMTLSCTSSSAPGQTSGTQACTAVTINNSPTACSGEFIDAMFVEAAVGQATIANFHSTLGGAQTCFDNTSLPIVTEPFAGCVGSGSLAPGGSFTMTANISGATSSVIIAV